MTRFAPFLRLGAAVLLSSLGAGTARAATFVVDRTDDLPDNNPGNGQCSVGGGPPRCTLRAAIMEANASAGADVINFNIGGGGPQTIVITSPLPPITGVVTIDGTTQPGFVNAAPYTPVITVDGSAVAGSGLVLAAGSSGSTIRGLAIYGFSGATHAEIEINASATNLVVGNRLCVDRTGTVAMGGWAGVLVTAGSTGNTIGGTTAANRNIISGAATDGVQISVGGTSNNVVTGNYIGLDVNGTTGLGNAAKGVAIWGGASNNTVGGTAAGAGNVISGNNLLGVEISDAGTTGNLVQGNRIGTDVSGTLNRGNTSYGVRLRLGATGNSIGGAAAGAGNTIAYSGLQGIVVTESATVGDSILGNSIYSNGGLGIDLNDDGVTANDTGDVDTGPNNLQNFPVLSAAMTNGTQATFAGSYSATAAVATYRIEFFASAAADPTGYGEGQRYLGFTNVTTNAAGSAVIAATLVPAVPLANGELVTATATDAANNTSEFGNAIAAVNHLVVTTTSDAADGITTSVANLIANPGADGRISLREAILAANATAGADTITFGIPLTDANHYYYRDNGGAGFSAEVTTTLADVASASSPAIPDFDANYPPGLARSWYRIQPGSAYAAMTGPTTLDATTQRGYLVGGPVVEVVGNLAGTGVRPFLVTVGTATSTFRGFVVNRFAREAFSFGATGTVVQGNYVGTDVSGTIARGNGTDGTGAGIYVGGANSQIGGLNPGDRNVISADGDWGLFIDAQNVVVCGNYIGTDVTGTVALGNTKGGIDLFNGANPSTNNTIGGTVAGARNVISGNVGPGIRISEGGTVNSNTIKGNSIGTNAAGTGSLPNNQQGILVSSGTTGNLIFLNTIADNTLAGVAVVGATTTGNAILTNAIYGNGALGIDLNNDGVTANDAGDGDAGPNDLQNYPVLGAAVTDGASSAYFTGTLNSTANATFRVEFFASAAPDPSGFGEGQRFLAFTSVTTNGAGNAAFNVALPATLAAGEYVTATATNPANSTSEFSASVVATAVNLVTVGTGCTGGKVPTGANFVVHGAFDGGATPAANNFTTSVWNGGICPNDTGETIRTTTGNCGGLNVAITQFPGDPAAGIAGTPDSLYANGNNTFPVGGPAPYQPYLVWRQTVTGLTQNTTYTFYVYASNANNGAVVQPGILPTLRFCMGVTGGPPYGCATTLTAADFAIPNETAATGDVWGRYQVSFTTGAGQTTADLAILDAATNTNGDDVQITRIGVQACGLPTAVELMSFTATGRDRAVDLAWQTGSELDNLGFNLYRSSSSSGPWTRLNASLIPGLGSSPLGAAYSWRDSGLVNGQRYSYRLEDVDTRSVSTFHGPISAVPQAVAPNDGGGPSGGSGGSGPSPSSSSCPSWVLAASGFSPGESETPPSCQSYGDPSLTSLRVVSQSLQGAVLELETSGFVAMREGSGSVRAFIPGFDLPTEASSAALPMRRAVVDAVVGRGVRLESVEALSLEHFPGLWPGAVGKAGIEVTADGTVRPSRRPVRMSSVGRGMVPGDWARLGGAVFQGETKRAVVEITPLRFDASRSELVLARRVFVKLSFTGVEGGERGSGRLGRRVPGGAARSSEALAELYTTGRGLYAISFSDLFLERRRGMDVSLLSLERQGVAVPFHVEPDEPVFGPGSILYFYSDHVSSSTEYSAETAYELVRSGVGVRMGVGVGAPHGSAVAPGSRGTRSYETNRIYQAGLLEAPDPWLWEALGGGITRTESFALTGVDGTSSEEAKVVVFLQGGSDAAGVVDHHVRIYVNGALVGETLFDGEVGTRIEASLPVSLLLEGANTLSVENVGDTGVYSLVFLDRFSVEYPQASVAEGGVFEGVWTGSGVAEVTGLAGAPPALLDLTAEGGAAGSAVLRRLGSGEWLRGMEMTAGGVRFSAQAGHHYLVVSPEGLLRPRIAIPTPSSLKEETNQADFLVIGPQAFLPAAEPLLERRAGQGLVSRGVSLEEIGAVFGHGQPSAEAIRDFLSYAYHSWRRPSPRYVLLLGESTYDPQRFLASSHASPLPALWVKTTYLWTVSDPTLAAVNGDDLLPDLAIGRLPATTVEEAAGMVGKVLDWEDTGQSLEGQAVFVADNPDEAGDFEADAEDLALGPLAGRQSEVLKVSELGPATRAAILGAFDSGVSLMSYVGHGGTQVWASENVLNSWDVSSLQAQSRQPFMMTMDCLNGYFVAPNIDALSVAFLKVEGRGVVGSFSPSGLSLDGPAHLLHGALLTEIASGRHQRLGDAVLAAQKDYIDAGALPELLSVYHLLGDPTLTLR